MSSVLLTKPRFGLNHTQRHSGITCIHFKVSRQSPRVTHFKHQLNARKPSDSDDGWESFEDLPNAIDIEDGGESWRSDISLLAASLKGELSMEQEAYYSDANSSKFIELKERCILVGASTKSSQRPGKFQYSLMDSLEELGRLADTAGLEVVGQTYQLLDDPNPRTYVGAGKLSEIAKEVERTGAETVIFDDELTPGQLRNLDRALGGNVRLCDRTALILDIFSQRAATREGQLQVQLAQVEYQLPRLTRMWSHLERQTGGGGAGGQVKGMGEKQIEIDRRLLRDRAAKLRRDIEEVRTHRKAYRERRAQASIPVVALVGYTNAGKSTLLNTLTNAGVLSEDKLFATLDPTTRKLELPGGGEVLFSDTVGFIQKLPTQLVAAFRATLEEIKEASILLHVVDVSHSNAAAQVEAVNNVLKELGAHALPTLTVWNKVDACADPDAVQTVAAARESTTCLSARTGQGVGELLEAIAEKLKDRMTSIHCLIPYTHGDLVEEIHRCGVVEEAEYTGEGTVIKAFVPPSIAGRVSQFDVVVGGGDKVNGGAAASKKGRRKKAVIVEEEEEDAEEEAFI